MRDLIHHVQLMYKETGLVLLGPAGRAGGMAPISRIAAKLTYDQRLVINARPSLTIRVLRTTVIPSEVLVQPQHIEKLAQRVAKNVSIRSVVFHPVHRRSNQACRVELAGVFRQSSKEDKPIRVDRGLIRE